MLKRSVLNQYANSPILKSASCNESRKSEDERFDIFLCHSSKDREEIRLLKAYLKDKGYNAYVDWIDDPQLDRTKVSQETAKILQKRMNNSRQLYYVLSSNSTTSIWMPWELGYFDGLKTKQIFVYPIFNNQEIEIFDFKGAEYLTLYQIKDMSEDKFVALRKLHLLNRIDSSLGGSLAKRG